ncbi:hypothetical protein [Longibaculum muris]|uniref:hypothetical protein n=1 Tax=Longibaculum muris TaxID=1796628 RepID=UPI0022E6807B|nr:hypothetical protein [Longibaculum muris]
MNLPKREIKVEENLHYVEPITELMDLTFTKPTLAGDGLTDWTQSSNPDTSEGQYIHEKTKHNDLNRYAPQVSYSGVAYPGDDFNYWLYLIGKREVIGARFNEFEVETWNPVGSDKTYTAYKRTYDVQPSNPGSGAGGEKLAIEGTFSQVGSVIAGTYNIATGTFTEATAAAKAVLSK